MFFCLDKSEPNTSIASTGASYVVEDFQLPPKFKRAGLDEAEINAINVSMFKYTFIFCTYTPFIFRRNLGICLL